MPQRPEFREETPVTRQEEDHPLPVAYFDADRAQGNEEKDWVDSFLRILRPDSLTKSASCLWNERKDA